MSDDKTIIPSKCDLVRKAIWASYCGACNNQKQGLVIPPECKIIDVMNRKDLLFNGEFNPFNFLQNTAQERTIYINLLKAGIMNDENALKALYGENAPIDISWSDVLRCQWSGDGTIGGMYDNITLGRNDIEHMGYSSRPILIGKDSYELTPGQYPLVKKVPQKYRMLVPISMDRYFNPAVSFALIILLIFVTCAAVISNLIRWRFKGRTHKKRIKHHKSSTTVSTSV